MASMLRLLTYYASFTGLPAHVSRPKGILYSPLSLQEDVCLPLRGSLQVLHKTLAAVKQYRGNALHSYFLFGLGSRDDGKQMDVELARGRVGSWRGLVHSDANDVLQ